MGASVSNTLTTSYLQVGDTFTYGFSFGQKELDDFVALSGDSNNIHQEEAAALRSPIGKMAVPGMLTAMIFSRVLGTMFPGHGTVYRSQTLEFLRPVILGREYEARFEVVGIEIPSKDAQASNSLVPRRPRATIRTLVVDIVDGKVCLQGLAVVLNEERLEQSTIQTKPS
jgi:acyl dehydratase